MVSAEKYVHFERSLNSSKKRRCLSHFFTPPSSPQKPWQDQPPAYIKSPRWVIRWQKPQSMDPMTLGDPRQEVLRLSWCAESERTHVSSISGIKAFCKASSYRKSRIAYSAPLNSLYRNHLAILHRRAVLATICTVPTSNAIYGAFEQLSSGLVTLIPPNFPVVEQKAPPQKGLNMNPFPDSPAQEKQELPHGLHRLFCMFGPDRSPKARCSVDCPTARPCPP